MGRFGSMSQISSDFVFYFVTARCCMLQHAKAKRLFGTRFLIGEDVIRTLCMLLARMIQSSKATFQHLQVSRLL
jgi:hypothetical protein